MVEIIEKISFQFCKRIFETEKRYFHWFSLSFKSYVKIQKKNHFSVWKLFLERERNPNIADQSKPLNFFPFFRCPSKWK